MPKPCNPRELVARIRAILRRTQVPEPAGPSSGPLTAGALTLWPERRALEWRGEPLELTSTEFNLFEAEATGRHVEFVGAGEALVIANAELLHRALENVVRNAVKFTNEGTTVAVEITRHSDSNQLVVTVSDRGPGVPEEENITAPTRGLQTTADTPDQVIPAAERRDCSAGNSACRRIRKRFSSGRSSPHS